MTPLLEERAERVFPDKKPPYTPDQAAVEANRCLFCHDAPCIQACPTGIDIPQFIRKIATGNLRGSAKTIFDSNILGMSCARVCPVEVLCVGSCVYNHMGVPPIQIGRLQRYATDLALDREETFYEAGPPSGKSVGVIGGGPAGLACAHMLRRHGHAVTIYEKRERLGGLNATGVAPYKMQADRALEEVDWVLKIGGIEVKTGVSIPEDVSFTELEKRHDALFLGCGLGEDTVLPVPGADLGGIHGAVALIEQLKTTALDLAHVRVATVIGGGNTAIDVVRELLGLGIPVVKMLYRGAEAGMSGYAHEWEYAKKEGARAIWQVQPIGYVGEEGRVRAVRCLKLDKARRPVAGSEHDIPTDLVVLAVGQKRLGEALAAGLPGVKVDGGRVVAEAGGRTGRKGVYAGGDGANGGKEVVNAVAEGRDAARAIHAFLAEGGSCRA